MLIGVAPQNIVIIQTDKTARSKAEREVAVRAEQLRACVVEHLLRLFVAVRSALRDKLIPVIKPALYIIIRVVPRKSDKRFKLIIGLAAAADKNRSHCRNYKNKRTLSQAATSFTQNSAV